MYLRELEMDYSIKDLENIAMIHNHFSEGPIVQPRISEVECIGVVFFVESITTALKDARRLKLPEFENECLTLLDKVKNAIASIRIGEQS
jgi:hypothetical protein